VVVLATMVNLSSVMSVKMFITNKDIFHMNVSMDMICALKVHFVTSASTESKLITRVHSSECTL